MKKFLGGEYYGYPIVMDDLTDSDIVNQHGMYYRRDWYENLKAKNIWLICHPYYKDEMLSIL